MNPVSRPQNSLRQPQRQSQPRLGGALGCIVLDAWHFLGVRRVDPEARCYWPVRRHYRELSLEDWAAPQP